MKNKTLRFSFLFTILSTAFVTAQVGSAKSLQAAVRKDFTDNTKFYLEVESGSSVSMNVTSDYNAVFKLTAPEDGKALVNASEANVYMMMQNVTTLDVDKRREYENTFRTDFGTSQPNLVTWLSNAYGFEGCKINVDIDGNETDYVFDKAKVVDGFTTINATTDTEKTRAAWHSLTSHLLTGTKEDNSYISIANGSYILAGTQKLAFKEGFAGDLLLDNLSDFTGLKDNVANALKVTDCDNQGDKITLYAAAGTKLAVSSSYAELKHNYTVEVTLNGEYDKDIINDGIFNRFTGEKSSKEIAEALMNSVNDFVGIFDACTSVDVKMYRPIETISNEAGTCDIEGLVPNGSTVAIVEYAGKDDILVSYDISLKNKGVEVQPDGTIKITLTVAPEVYEEDFELLHLHDHETTNVEYKKVGDNKIEFSVDSLSVFQFKKKSINVVGVTLSATEMSMIVGNTATLIPSISPKNASNKNVIWRSTNDKVVTVNNKGDVTAVGSGVADVVVETEDGKFAAKCRINVTMPVQKVELDVSVATLYVGNNQTLNATITPANASNQNVTWTSSNENVATVKDGVVTAVAPGNATITVKTEDGGKTASCGIKVEMHASGITLDSKNVELIVKDTHTLTATVAPENATNKEITWTSSNENVATVKDGVITAVGKGTATITATTVDGNYSAKCEVKVKSLISVFAVVGIIAGFTLGIVLFLLAKLLFSYPLVILGALFMLGSSGLAFVQGYIIIAICWLLFSALSVLFAGFYYYKNVRGAFWWSLGSILAMVCAAVPFEMFVAEELATILSLGAAFALFFVVGLLGSIIVPRLTHKERIERNHLTNIDPMIGQLLKVEKAAEGDFPARGSFGDIDWAVCPLYSFEKFKEGDVVKVQKIQGVTLVCTRDGKDYRAELRRKHAEEKAAAKAASIEKNAAKKAAKEAKAAEKEAEKAAKKSKAAKVKPVKKVEEKPAVAAVEVKENKPAPTPVEPTPVEVEEPKIEPAQEQPAVEENAAKQKAEFIPFQIRMKQADKELKQAYNELKSEVLSYGIKSRVSTTGDTFRLHTKEYVKMVIAGKNLKLYLALNPKDYVDSTYPFDDASRMAAHKETPFVFKITSGLSVRRAKILIADLAKKNNLTQGEIVQHNHAKDVQ